MSIHLPAPETNSSPSPTPAADAVRVLLVEDDPEYAYLVRRTLSKATAGRFSVEHAETLDRAMRCLETADFDALLIDLSLPDGQGLLSIGVACLLADRVPVLVLTGDDDDDLAMAAVKSGAHEYLVKHRLDRRTLPSLILRAIDRHRYMARLGPIEGLADVQQRTAPAFGSAPELCASSTGVGNEVMLCDRLDHAIAQADLRSEQIGVILLRFDDFEEVRRVLGNHRADEILHGAALRIGMKIRRSDTLVSNGPDDFVVILENLRPDTCLASRLEALLACLAGVELRFSQGSEVGELTASAGVAIYPSDGCDVETLVENAEEALRRAALAGGGRACFYRDPGA